jgi:plastocyanin
MKLRSTLLGTMALTLLGFVSLAPADITGTVKLDGKPPEMKEIDMSAVKDCAAQHADPVLEETVIVGEGGGLANVVVALKPDDPSALGGEVPKEPVVLDQKGCQYSPHVIAMMVGQEMVVKNSDPFLHNVHSLAQQNPAFNFGQPNKDDGKKVDSPKTAETYKVKCDVHPWMSAHVAVFEHPFFAVTDDKGQFTIKGNVPDGDYTVTAWHEKLPAQEGKVSVKDGKGTVDFTFKSEGAAAPAENPATPKLASADRPAACCATK